MTFDLLLATGLTVLAIGVGLLLIDCTGPTQQDLNQEQLDLVVLQASQARLGTNDGGPTPADVAAARALQRGAIDGACAILRRNKADAGTCP
jgi:hypothetical protein